MSSVDRGSHVPLHRQVYHDVREAILARRLTSGMRLPSSREMAADIGVSRNTIVSAFEQLLAEGYVEARVGAGTHVAFTLPAELLGGNPPPFDPPSGAIPRAAALSRRGTLLARTPMSCSAREDKPRAFQVGVPAVDTFPFRTWHQLMSRRWRQLPRSLLYYGDPAGYWPLREAVAAYLRASRAVRCRRSRSSSSPARSRRWT